MSKKNLENLEINISAVQKEDESVDFGLKVSANCSVPFMAEAFAKLIKEDNTIKAAMAIAVLDAMYKENGRDIKDDLDALIKNTKVHAQA